MRKFRPGVECLEDRTAPAVYEWVGRSGVGPQFGSPMNWLRDGAQTDTPPGANDYCVINEDTPDPWVLEDITVGGLYMQDLTRINLRAPLRVISPQGGVLGSTHVSDIRFTNPIVPGELTYLEIGNFPQNSPAVIGGEMYEDDPEERWCFVQISSGYATQGDGLRLHNVDRFIVGPGQPAGLVSAQFTLRRAAADMVVSNNDGNPTHVRSWNGGMIYFEPRQDPADGGNLIQDQFNNSLNLLVAQDGGRIDFGTFFGPAAVSETVVELSLKADSAGEFQFGKDSIVHLVGSSLNTVAAGGKMVLRNGAYVASLSSEGLAVHGTLESVGAAGTTVVDNFWYELGQGRVTVHNGGTVKFAGIGSKLHFSWLHLLAGSNMKMRLTNAQLDFSDTVHVANRLDGTAGCVWLEFTNEVVQTGQYNHLFFTWDLGCVFALDPLLIFRQNDMVGQPYQDYGIGETSTEALFVSWLV